MTRDDVLDVLDKVAGLKRRGVDRRDIPVQFIENRVAITLPADKFTPDEKIRLGGKFQNLMTNRKGAHAFLDFSENWIGLKTRLTGGF